MEVKTLLVDGDIIKYRCAFAAEHTYYLLTCADLWIAEVDSYKEAKAEEAKWDADKYGACTIWNRKVVQPEEFALQATKTLMDTLIARIQPESIRVILSGEKNFRDAIAVTQKYKGNRDGQAKPVHFAAVEEYLKRQWNAEVTDRIEADDAIGIALSSAPDTSVVATLDKDIDQITGWHFNWVNDELYSVSKRDAAFALYTQVLTGDSTDNVPGLPGIGKQRAGKILESAKNPGELAKLAFAAYRRHFDTVGRAKEYFLEQGRLVYIWRKPEDDFLNQLPEGIFDCAEEKAA